MKKRSMLCQCLIALVLCISMIGLASCSNQPYEDTVGPAQVYEPDTDTASVNNESNQTPDSDETPDNQLEESGQDTDESDTGPESENDPQTLGANEMYSFLTGEPIDQDTGMNRPLAIAITNASGALPPSGLDQASLIYEVLVESQITRFVALFESVENIEAIGSIHSARHNFYDLAYDDEAISIFYGWSNQAESRAVQDGTDYVNGMVYGTDVFYRADGKTAPNDVYSPGKVLEDTVAQRVSSRKLPDNYEGRLSFSIDEEVELTGGTNALSVSIQPLTSDTNFTYSSTAKSYTMYQGDTAITDELSNQPLTFKNLIIQKAEYTTISNQGHQDIALTGEGEAVYITNGKAVEIKWEKPSGSSKTNYYYEDGTQVLLNPGKTYIALVPTSYTYETN